MEMSPSQAAVLAMYPDARAVKSGISFQVYLAAEATTSVGAGFTAWQAWRDAANQLAARRPYHGEV
jgi:hypothetical protein